MASVTDRVIVVGLDGLDPGLVDILMNAGRLPNFRKLVGEGSPRTVATTTPAQTPVAWSTFATGRNPGGHGIFDFLRRSPDTYLPDLGLNTYERKNAFTPPKAVNLRRAPALWEHLTAAGIPSAVIRHPCAFPPERIRGRLLSGMGVPDIRGGFGTSTFYTTREGVPSGESEVLVTLGAEARTSDQIQTYVVGPQSPKDGTPLRFDLDVTVDRDAKRLMIRSSGSPKEVVVEQGGWSPWLMVKFKLGFALSAKGIVRFHLMRMSPDLEFYASPVNFDPYAPMFPISHPMEYAFELADEFGLFHTTGMVEDHTGLINERINEEAFLAQCEDAWRERESMLERELNRRDSRFLYCLFDTTDRIQHMFWRFGEPSHPANRGKTPDPTYASVIADQYARGDAIVGRVLEHVDDRTLLIVLSDHGFTSFRRGVNLNGWLHRQGLLHLIDDQPPGVNAGDLLRSVDWTKTQAYALGLSGLYLNIRGREGQGIVNPDDAPTLRRQLAEALTGLRDPALNATAILSASPREAVYSGPFTDEAPDILVNYETGYRASWSSSLGGIEENDFEDNTRKWSGDHIVAPERVPGVLVSNRSFAKQPARLIDLAPTILEALDCPRPEDMEGVSLLS